MYEETPGTWLGTRAPLRPLVPPAAARVRGVTPPPTHILWASVGRRRGEWNPYSPRVSASSRVGLKDSKGQDL